MAIKATNKRPLPKKIYSFGALASDTPGYENDPVSIKKANEMIALLDKVGLPKQVGVWIPKTVSSKR